MTTGSRSIADVPRLARFSLVRELGGGAQGQVHEAIDLERDLRVALKTLRLLGPEEIARFKAEFRAVRDLRHPNLVMLGELIEDAGRWFFTMELVLGVDFLTHVRAEPHLDESTSWPAQRTSEARTRIDPVSSATRGAALGTEETSSPDVSLQTRGNYDEARLRDSLRQLASGLSFLHAAGKVHRDLKPSNVLVDAGGRVVLIDFGVVAELAARDDEAQIVGTVPYMAPEQALVENVGPAADWYAMGVLLFEALSGRRPFEGADVLERKCAFEAPKVGAFVRDVPRDLEALCARLLARDSERRPSGDEIRAMLGVQTGSHAITSSRPPAPSSSAFVGRRHELDALALAYRAMREGGATCAFVEGESGVGKSTLVRQFLGELRSTERKIVILEGRCHEQERVPYNAFDAVIDALARYVRGRREATRALLLPPGIDRLQKLFPTLGALEAGGSSRSRPPTFDPRADREDAFATLRELLRRVAIRRPTVLFLDDVQWADADSLALLEALTLGPEAPPLLILATARTRPEGGSCAALDAMKCAVHRVSLGGLPEEDANALVDQLLSRRVASGEIHRASILESTHGHPMFIEELVRYLARPHADGGSVVLDDALFARVAEFAPPARRILSLVAAAGMPIANAVVAEAAQIAPAEYAEHVADLRDARLVRIRGERQEDAIEPYHDRVRESVLARQSAEERASLHASLGAVLEERGAGAELLFHHFALAGDHERATRYAESAAEAAARALAFDRSVALYRSALAAGAHDPARRRRLLTALGDRLCDAGRSKEAADTFIAAAEIGPLAASERLDLERRAAEQFLMGGHLAQGLAATRVLLRAHGLSLPSNRLVALARLGWVQLRLGMRSLTWTPKRVVRADSPAIARVDVCWSVGAGLGIVDSVRSMIFVYTGALLAVEHGDEARIARALSAAAVGEAGLGRRAQATRLGEACHRAAASDGSDRARFYATLTTLASRFFLDNDWSGCLAEAQIAERTWQSLGLTEGWEADIVALFVCWSLDNSGRFRELAERVVPRIRAAQRAGNRFTEVTFRTQFVHLSLLRDRPSEARADVEDAIASWLPGNTEFGNQEYLALRSLTLIALYSGDLAAASLLLRRWKRYFQSLMSRVVFLRQDALSLVGSIAVALAADADVRGDRDAKSRRVRDARNALEEVETIDLPMARANARRLRAGVLAVEGDRDGARIALAAALHDADARGIELDAACIRLRLAELVNADEAAFLRAAADAWMARQGAIVPARLVAALLPGWPYPG